MNDMSLQNGVSLLVQSNLKVTRSSCSSHCCRTVILGKSPLCSRFQCSWPKMRLKGSVGSLLVANFYNHNSCWRTLSAQMESQYHNAFYIARQFSTKSDSRITKVQSAKEKVAQLRQSLSESRKKIKLKSREENIWTFPNFLCVLRMGLAPVLAALVIQMQYQQALILFVFVGFTDVLDGFIARTIPGQASFIGSFLDPAADKILAGFLFLSLTFSGLIPAPLTGLIISRDLALIGAASYIRYQSLQEPRTLVKYFNVTQPTAQLAPTLISKVNTGIQLTLVASTLVSASSILPYNLEPFVVSLWYITAATTIGSALSYIFSKDTYKFLNSNPGMSKAKELHRRITRQKEKRRNGNGNKL